MHNLIRWIKYGRLYPHGPKEMNTGSIYGFPGKRMVVTYRETDQYIWVDGYQRFIKPLGFFTRHWHDLKKWISWAWWDYKETWIIHKPEKGTNP